MDTNGEHVVADLEVDVSVEQQLKRTQTGNSWVWPRGTSGLLPETLPHKGLQSTGLRKVRRTCADVVKEATPQKHTYFCSEERTVVRRPVLLLTRTD